MNKWKKENNDILWRWVGLLMILGSAAITIFGGILLYEMAKL